MRSGLGVRLPHLLIAPLLGAGLAVHAALPDLPRAEAAIVARSNAFRADQGEAALKVQPQLTAAARQFADYMAGTDRYGHEADGRTAIERAQAQGYAWCLVAENIAMQFSSSGFETDELAAQFVQGWIESPGHRRNLLNAAATEIGVAVAHGPRSDRYYAVQVFGRPASQALRFDVTNRSSRDVRYRLGAQTFTLPSGATRRHEQCSTEPIEVIAPSPSGAAPVDPRDGVHYRIEGSGSGVRIVGDDSRR